MSTVEIAAGLFLLIQAGLKLDPPPPPDFKTPVDYAAWLDKQVVRGQSKEDNAAELYTAIFGRLDADPPADLGFKGPRTQEPPVPEIGPWDPKEHPEWEATYQKTRDKIEQFKRAAAKPYAWWGLQFEKDEKSRTLFNVVFKELTPLRQLAQGASEHAWRAEGGKIDEAAFVANVRAILSLARQIERNPLLIAQLVGGACRSIAYGDLLRAAELGVFSEKQRSAVVLLLAGRDDPPPSFRAALYADMASQFDLIQTIKMKHNGKFGFSANKGLTMPGSLSCNAPVAVDEVKDLTQALEKEMSGPYAPESVARMEEALTRTKGEMLLSLVVPNYVRPYLLRTRCEATRRATRLMYEILIYYDKNKKWPASLDELPPQAQKAAKVDPFSAKPFGYRLENDKPLLYSAAQNGKDDGGTKHDKRWGDETEGADYIFSPGQ